MPEIILEIYKLQKHCTVSLRQYRQAHPLKATFAVNRELIKLCWYIGRSIAGRQEESGWGSNVIAQLAKDLQNGFPGIAGFSRANVFHMRSFFLAYEKVQQVAGQI